MDVLYERLPKEAEYCINCMHVEVPCFDVPWHFHPETEILYIEESSGYRFVGDHSEPFRAGDVGLIGPNLPHVWKNDPVYHRSVPGLSARAMVIHFHNDIYKGPLSVLPEMQAINQLLFDSQFGIKFVGSAADKIKIQMQEIIKTAGIEKMLKLTRMLEFMSATDEKQLLASPGYASIRKSADFDRFDKVHQYMIDHFRQSISLAKIADIVGMTPTSFCRYFKKRTKKSFHTVLNEIRVGHACKLLIEHKMNISGVCYESGFSNLSNFNQQFKKIKGISPNAYIRQREKQS